MQAFFAEHPIEQAAKTLEQVLERQRVNTALRGPRAASASPTALLTLRALGSTSGDESARSGRIRTGRPESVPVELRGIEPLASTVRLLRSTN